MNEFLLLFSSELDYRIDYTLEHSMVEYFSAITSHQAYWHNIDFAKFVLHHIYHPDMKSDLQTTDSKSSLGSPTKDSGSKL